MSESDSSHGAARRPALPKMLIPLAVMLGIVAGLSVLLLKPAPRATLPGGAVETATGAHGYYGTLALPAKPAPPIDLRNYLGHRVTLGQFHGRAVLVTFLYTNCPEICPLIASNLRVALHRLGSRAHEVQLVAVSVDPRGDTPAAVARFLRVHGLTGQMQYLIGSGGELARTWSAWSVGSTREVGQPDQVAHSALVYGVSAKGTLTTIYPATFEPSEIVHDVPRLASH